MNISPAGGWRGQPIPAKPPIPERVITWILCITFLYLAGHGSILIHQAQGNIAGGGMYAGIVNATSSNNHDWSEMLAAYSMLVISAFLALMQGRQIWRVFAQNKILSALIALPLLSTVWSQSPHVTLVSAVYLAGNYLFAAYLSTRFSAEEQADLFSVFGWVAILLSFALAMGFPDIGIDRREGLGAWQGMFVQKNSAAVCIVFLISAQLAQKKKALFGSIGRAVLLCLSVGLLILTQSRTGWIIFGVYLSFLALVRAGQRLGRSERLLFGTLASAAAIAVCTFAYLYAPLVLSFIGKDGTITGRIPLWKAVSGTIARQLLTGYGYQAFWEGMHGGSADIQLAVGWAASHAQNGFLDTLLGLGVLGFGLLILTMLLGARDGWKSLKGGADLGVEWYLSIILITFICNLSERTIMYPHFIEWIMYMIACIGLSGKMQVVRSNGGAKPDGPGGLVPCSHTCFADVTREASIPTPVTE
ncbi:MAG TPA: O-antigen ligase family protein [Terriglobales bacterium]|nr:O-antigen ligase family protein [Terriglobales bacterium]